MKSSDFLRMQAITDPKEMRKLLRNVAYGICLAKGHDVMAVAATVRAVYNMAEANGLSGEDLYTVMAWHMMLRASDYAACLLEASYLNPAPPLIYQNPPPVGPQAQPPLQRTQENGR